MTIFFIIYSFMRELDIVFLFISIIIGYIICYYLNYLPQQNDLLKQKKQHLKSKTTLGK